MIPEAVLEQLRALGVSLRAEGETILLRPFSVVPPDLLTEAKAHKAALLTLLRAAEPASPSPPELPRGAAEWLMARTESEHGCCVGVGDAVADFFAYVPSGDPLVLVHALEAGVVPGARIGETANGARLVVGLRIGNVPVLNATGPDLITPQRVWSGGP